MRTLDLKTWPRRRHFEFFKAFDYPHFNLCANMDVSALFPYIKQRSLSITATTAFLLAKAANAFPEFRWRIRGDQVVEHDLVHPSPTLLTAGDLFSFCTMPYDPSFRVFHPRALAAMEKAKNQPTLQDEPGQDNLLFMTSVPWVSFTSFQHPIHMHPADSIPRMAWGKAFTEGGALKMPLSVEAHHSLMDGVHVGRYYAMVQEYFSQPETSLGL